MNSEKIEQQYERKIEFWTILGPVLLLLTFFVALIKEGSSGVGVAGAGLVGLIISWRFKVRGLWAATGLLIAVGLVDHLDVPLEDRFWHLGLGLAVFLGFAVTALSFEEVAGLIGSLRLESNSRLENLWRLDEKLNRVHESWNQDREKFSSMLRSVNAELKEATGERKSATKITELLREELEVRGLENSALNDKVQEMERERFRLEGRNAELEQLTTKGENERIRSLTKELDEMRKMLRNLQEATPCPDDALEQEIRNRIDDQNALRSKSFQQELALGASNLTPSHEVDLDAMRSQCERQERQILALERQVRKASLAVEKPVLPMEVAELRAELASQRQLREQFESKKELLGHTRRELFVEREKVSALDTELREIQLDQETVSIQLLSEAERVYEEVSDENQQLKELVEHLLQEIATMS